jgi:erythromycin esterase
MRCVSLFLVLIMAMIDHQAYSQDSPIQGIELSTDSYEDLAFLKPLLANKRLVQLGENNHGIAEYNLVKARLVRFLHEEMGFNLLAFESSLFQCFDVDQNLAENTPRSSLFKSVFGVWHTEEVLPLFAYLRERQDEQTPLRLMGFDIQPIGANKKHRPDFLAEIVARFDAAYAEEVLALDKSFLEEYGKGGRARRAFFRSEAGQTMMKDYGHLQQFLSRSPASDEVVIARQIAFSMAAYIRQQNAGSNKDYVIHRDHGMAQNLIALLEEVYPNEKVIVWAHNYHIRHANQKVKPHPDVFPGVEVKTMGHWLKEHYGDKLFTIGLYAYQGQARNNRGKIFDIPPGAEGSLEARLHATGHDTAFLDLTNLPADSPFAQPITARYNGETPLTMTLAEHYNAVISIRSASPSEMLR